MTRAPVIVARGLHASYRTAEGRHPVLRGVDLEVAEGELVALVGPNGSGKTTLLRCLAGTLRPDGGTVSLLGRPIEEWSRIEVARRVAVLPQWLELPDGFRVDELVEMGRMPHARRLFGSDADDASAVERALADADATELAKRYAAELSGGERQRVVVAMALAQEPELLLLDEPTLHLDVAHATALLATVQRLRRRRGLTVVAVLHDLNLAIASAPRVVLLGEGRIVADGTPRGVLRADLVRDLFGVAVEEATTPDGRRFLVPHAGGAVADEGAANDPSRRLTPARRVPRRRG